MTEKSKCVMGGRSKDTQNRIRFLKKKKEKIKNKEQMQQMKRVTNLADIIYVNSHFKCRWSKYTN